jgi:uncharacterized protein YndB with AHSA1/START domain
MRMRAVTATRRTDAAPEQVWHLLAHTATWPGWAPVRAATLERQGSPEADGIGAVRSFTTQLGTTTREEIIAFDPSHHVGYMLRSGLPVRDYRSDVRLEPTEGGGTTITWTSSFRGSWVMMRLVGLTLRRFSRALARGANRVPTAV